MAGEVERGGWVGGWVGLQAEADGQAGGDLFVWVGEVGGGGGGEREAFIHPYRVQHLIQTGLSSPLPTHP